MKKQVSAYYKETEAFTLAEVLIVLLIIGVVASLVIPGIIADTQMAEYKTAWKKAFADVNQATKMIMANNGGSLKGLCGDSTPPAQYDCLKDEYAKYLKVIKSCNVSEEDGTNNCWYSTPVKELNGAPRGAYNQGSGLQLTNGETIGIQWRPVWNTGDAWGTGCSDTSYGMICGLMEVDTNGSKGPNQLGKDVFGMHISGTRGVIPSGIQGDGTDTGRVGPHGTGCNLSIDSQATGDTCAADYLK